MAGSVTYETRRSEIETYFDRTAAETWKKLTSTAPVGRVRATVRRGRDAMRATLLSYLPSDMSGLRVLDAGCGTGALAMEAARRGADVVAVDLSPTLTRHAQELADAEGLGHKIRFCAGDMLDPALGRFDHVVMMDSIIHYEPADAVMTLGRIAERTDGSLAVTFAPRTPMLAIMHKAGKLFPRADRSPAIVPVAKEKLVSAIERHPAFAGFDIGRDVRVDTGFYKSHALELKRR
ncbi:magnesium protoporphyrin IX methyltransferase [Fulvimarina sp. 2208YS6-2-32]|uniref:Magnesium protoporphyrin IX methyltransferase n=1 Tax=Fulvimarina uroteuthidis TaxID=3098149 RepID=A0ABU5HZE0_9HYPH|nr:magnesium protoporphyrin IX methyltransferase [Fulvimarina sp. 2208YS6-2-32]MDY8108495.1 magnesium protoporphyrin IX methyltransferase [Fulvimarina sp. 2208YS6-2-32]